MFSRKLETQRRRAYDTHCEHSRSTHAVKWHRRSRDTSSGGCFMRGKVGTKSESGWAWTSCGVRLRSSPATLDLEAPFQVGSFRRERSHKAWWCQREAER